MSFSLPAPFVRRLGLFVVYGLLLLLGFIQYQWFSRSATVEVEASYRNLFSAAFQTVSREFQRYAPVSNELKALALKKKLTGGELREALLRLLETYGPEGSAPGLLASVAYQPEGQSSGLVRYDRESGAWREDPEFAIPALPGPVRELMDKNEIILFGLSKQAPKEARNLLKNAQTSAGGEIFSERESPPKTRDSRILYLIHAGSEPSYLAVLQLDTEGFFENYIKPSMSLALSGYRISWEEPGPNAPGKSFRSFFNAKDYQFNPFKALFGLNSSDERSLLLPLPSYLDSLKSFDLRLPPPGSEVELQAGEGPPSGPEPERVGDFRVLLGKNIDRTRNNDDFFKMMRISPPEGGLLESVELRLALNWLVSVALLFVLGLAFFIVFKQADRLRLLRQKEREFVASVSHELRTPLTVIQSAADNLKGGIVPEGRFGQYGELLYDQSKRLGKLVEDVLLFSELEGRTAAKLPGQDCDLKALFDSIHAPLDTLARAKGIKLEWDQGALPESAVLDAESLRLILENLCVNALNHAYTGLEAGVVRVVGRSTRQGLRIVVEDDGRGLNPKEAKKVFEPFYRDGVSRKNQVKGTGLGLFLAKKRAELMGADLVLESPYERIDGIRRQGCRFRVDIPLGNGNGKKKGDKDKNGSSKNPPH